MPPNLRDLLHQANYSKGVVGTPESQYEGRTRITSKSDRVQGGVFMPPNCLKTIEAIVVDYEKDTALKSYIEGMEKYLMAKKAEFDKAQRPFDFPSMISVMSHKIAADFPYDKRMIENKFADAQHPPGKKVHLGVIMAQQHMVCRHMGLLAAAILDYFKENSRQKKGTLTLNPECSVRFMAESQQDLVEDEHNGHAYTVVRYMPQGTSEMQYYVIDPTGGRAIEVRELFKKKRQPFPGAYRYLFSVLRVVFQSPNTRDQPLLDKIFALSKTDANIVGVIQDLEKSLSGNVTSMQIVTKYKAKFAIK